MLTFESSEFHTNWFALHRIPDIFVSLTKWAPKGRGCSHATWTAWGDLHVACRMSTRLLWKIPFCFAFRNWSSLATQQMGRTRKRCEGHAKHKKAANEEVKNSRAVTGVATLLIQTRTEQSEAALSFKISGCYRLPKTAPTKLPSSLVRPMFVQSTIAFSQVPCLKQALCSRKKAKVMTV